MNAQCPAKGFIISTFGNRGTEGTRRFHEGVDISTPAGAPAVASFDGVVSSIRREAGHGWILSLSHGYGVVTSYGKIERTFVREGQHAKMGERIGIVGPGDKKGPQLRFQVRLNSLTVNPLLYISFPPFFTSTRLAS